MIFVSIQCFCEKSVQRPSTAVECIDVYLTMTVEKLFFSLTITRLKSALRGVFAKNKRGCKLIFPIEFEIIGH